MKKINLIFFTILTVCIAMSCGGGAQLPEKLEISLAAAEGYEGDTKGNAIIDTKSGTDITIEISGLRPNEIYTAFFVNIKSKMFEGIGQEPYTLPVDDHGTVSFKGKIKKDIYKSYTKLGIFVNPGKKPIKNPLGVKAKLGALIKSKKPKIVLVGKLR